MSYELPTVKAPLLDRALALAESDPRAAVALIEAEANPVARPLLLRALNQAFAY